MYMNLYIYFRKMPLSRPRTDNPVWGGGMFVWVSALANPADRNSVRLRSGFSYFVIK
jgi:hypothetical protein